MKIDLRHLVKCLLGIFIEVRGVTHRPLISFINLRSIISTEKMLLRIPLHTSVLALDRFGWMIYPVLAQRWTLLTAPILPGVITIVGMVRMLAWLAQVTS